MVIENFMELAKQVGSRAFHPLIFSHRLILTCGVALLESSCTSGKSDPVGSTKHKAEENDDMQYDESMVGRTALGLILVRVEVERRDQNQPTFGKVKQTAQWK